MYLVFNLFILLLLFNIHQGFSSTCRLKDQVSIVLPKTKLQCFRLLNGTHQTGCQSDKKGNSGTVIDVESIQEFMIQLEYFQKNEENIIALASLEILTPELINAFHNYSIINGIIFYGQTETSKFSEDASCPLSEFSIYPNDQDSPCHKWNQAALNEFGMRFLNWNKPIFYVDDERELTLLRNDCYDTFNRNLTTTFAANKQRCRAKLTMFMHGAGDAEICLRRQNLFYGFTDTLSMCEPLSSYNVFNLLPTLRLNETANIFLLSARLDAFSTFSGSIGGDVSVLTSVITILSIADAIGKKSALFETRAKPFNRQLMLSFFNGESLGYIGSGRAAFDMMNEQFPHKFKRYEPSTTGAQLGMKDIKMFLELQHIGFSHASNEYFLHVDGNVYEKNNDFLNELASNVKTGMSKNNISSAFFQTSQSSQTLPSSYQSFLRHNKNVVGAVFSSTKDVYHFNNINSFKDVQITNMNDRDAVIRHLHNIASGVMKAITGYVHNDPNSSNDFPVDSSHIEELAECFFSNTWNCTYFQQIIPNYQKHYHSYRNLYIGTTAQQSPMWYIVKALLIQALGETHATSNVNTEDQCNTLNPGQSVYHYVWAFNAEQNKSLCYRTNIIITQARSPSFTETGIHKAYYNYSTWVESVWDPHKLEVYLDGEHSNIFHIILSALVGAFAILLTCLDWSKVNPHAVPPVIIKTTQRRRSRRRVPPASQDVVQTTNVTPIEGRNTAKVSKVVTSNATPPVNATIKTDVKINGGKHITSDSSPAVTGDDITEPTPSTKLIVENVDNTEGDSSGLRKR